MRQKSNLVVFITPHIITENENLVLEKELEKYDLEDKNFIERRFHSLKMKLQSKVEAKAKDSTISQKPDSSSVETPVSKLQENLSVPVVSKPTPGPSDSSLHKSIGKKNGKNRKPKAEFSKSENKKSDNNRTEIKQALQNKPDSTDNQPKK
jgi:hypothetical protein